jgi:hypothetical protein
MELPVTETDPVNERPPVQEDSQSKECAEIAVMAVLAVTTAFPVRRATGETPGPARAHRRLRRGSPADSPCGADSTMGKKRGHLHSLNKQGPLSVWTNSE